ncbi:GIN domain-containing protein [Mucilaginibacter calamicampi]|uniref:GIN domain-containing protein n=1 Tax=Mucilaginibacter calamicampi TaxID=1302352 RepID=A0ABW2YYI9_9SPHI
MKTKFLTLITLATLSIATTSATFANTKTNNTVTVLENVKPITSIEAHGNVEIYVTNGNKDGVKVFDSYYNQNAMVQNENGVLRVASYKTDKVVIEVTVTDLRSISASDNAVIKSFGRFSSVDLDVVLNDNAAAQINVDAFTAKFTVNNRAKADISGAIEDYQLNYSRSATVNRTYLAATNRVENITTPPSAPKKTADTANLASL